MTGERDPSAVTGSAHCIPELQSSDEAVGEASQLDELNGVDYVSRTLTVAHGARLRE